ncbi:MAG: MerR family transcriptional regulator [Chloroflexota bacterium]
MYTIKQAAARSGVPVQLLRAWERRYGVVKPGRTDSGYRLYDEGAIERLRAMRQLIDGGWAPSTAAARIRELDDAAVDELLGSARQLERARAGGTVVGAAGLIEAFVSAAGELDEPALEQVLDDIFASASFEQVVSNLLMPALTALGDAWQAGRVDVAAEHFAAAAVQRRLGMAFMAGGRPADGQQVILVGLPPGAHHDLGALTFATTARRAGLDVLYLGPDLPLQDWLDAVARTSAVAVVIGAVVGSDVDPATRVARAIRAANQRVVIAFGGRASAAVKASAAEPALILPDDVVAAVEAVRMAIRSGPDAPTAS